MSLQNKQNPYLTTIFRFMTMPKLLLSFSVLLNILVSFNATAHTIDARIEKVSTDSSSFYHEMRLFDNKVSIMIPNTFSLMSEEIKAVKYPNTKQAPDVVYTNDKSTVNVAFNLKNFPTTQDNLPEVKEVFEKQLATLKPESFVSEIRSINGHKYIIYEFISPAVDTKIYNLMFLSDVDGKLLMGTFNCTVSLIEEWKPRALEILMSIKKSK